jgi:hypothetical protein
MVGRRQWSAAFRLQKHREWGAGAKTRKVRRGRTFLQPEGCAPMPGRAHASLLALRPAHGNVRNVELIYERDAHA